MLAEVGWPSHGRTREQAVASEANEAIFLRRFLHRAKEQGYAYYLMEAFDQPWKAQSEGSVGAYWGVYDVDRAQFSFTADIVRIPEWRLLSAVAVGMALLLLAIFSLDGRKLTYLGRGFLALVAYTSATTIVWVLYEYSQQYMTLTTVLVGVVLVLCTGGARRAARRGPRVGRSPVEHSLAALAAGNSHPSAGRGTIAQGVYSCAVLQRTTGHGVRNTKRSGGTQLSRL